MFKCLSNNREKGTIKYKKKRERNSPAGHNIVFSFNPLKSRKAYFLVDFLWDFPKIEKVFHFGYLKQ